VKHIFSVLIIISFCCSFVTHDNDYLDWMPNRSLSFGDFRGNIPADVSSKSAVSSSISLSYQITQIPGKTPEIIIFNRFDRNASWIQLKTQEILDLQQIYFDYSELYARKIRKEIKIMNQKNITDKQKYINLITQIAGKLSKVRSKENAMLYDQPHLIKIMKKDISDSLKLYADYLK